LLCKKGAGFRHLFFESFLAERLPCIKTVSKRIYSDRVNDSGSHHWYFGRNSITLILDYTTRAQVSEAVELLAGVKGPLAVYGYENKEWPGLVDTSPTATQINVALVGKYSKIDSTVQGTYPEGSITSVMTYGQAETKKVVFKTPDGGKIWDCSTGAGTDIDLKWRLRHVNKSLQIVPSLCI
jgi:type IV pilus assembly protein PilA